MYFSIFFKFCLILFTSAKSFQNKDPEAPIIHTNYGSIQGYAQLNSYMYLGIPFAKPPIGELRWKPTVETEPWAPNIYNATFFRPACPQSGCSGALCPPSVLNRFFLITPRLHLI